MVSNQFPLDVLPEPLQAIVLHKKEVVNWNVNTFATALLSATASTIGNNVKLDNGEWESKPILWVAVIGESGTGKTPMLEFAYKYLFDLDRKSMEEYFKRLDEYEINGGESQKPKEVNYILDDYTAEVLIPAHKKNPRGLAVFKDELSGWVKGFDKFKNGGKGEKETTLSLFNGKALKANRVGKTLFVPDSCVNVIGGIQPDKMKIINNKESQAEGFLQRFLMVRQPVTLNLITMERTNKDLVDDTYNLFDRVFNYPESILKVDEQTYQLYIDWRNKTERETYQDELERTIQQKLVGYLWKFCILIDVLDQCQYNVTRTYIAPETMEKAIQLVEFYRQEAYGVFEESYDPLARESEAFRELYNSLNGREYHYTELDELFKSILGSSKSRYDRYNNPELFTKVSKAKYKRAVQDVE